MLMIQYPLSRGRRGRASDFGLKRAGRLSLVDMEIRAGVRRVAVKTSRERDVVGGGQGWIVVGVVGFRSVWRWRLDGGRDGVEEGREQDGEIPEETGCGLLSGSVGVDVGADVGLVERVGCGPVSCRLGDGTACAALKLISGTTCTEDGI